MAQFPLGDNADDESVVDVVHIISDSLPFFLEASTSRYEGQLYVSIRWFFRDDHGGKRYSRDHGINLNFATFYSLAKILPHMLVASVAGAKDRKLMTDVTTILVQNKEKL